MQSTPFYPLYCLSYLLTCPCLLCGRISVHLDRLINWPYFRWPNHISPPSDDIESHVTCTFLIVWLRSSKVLSVRLAELAASLTCSVSVRKTLVGDLSLTVYLAACTALLDFRLNNTYIVAQRKGNVETSSFSICVSNIVRHCRLSMIINRWF